MPNPRCVATRLTTSIGQEFSEAEVVRTRDATILKDMDVVIDVGGVYDPGALPAATSRCAAASGEAVWLNEGVVACSVQALRSPPARFRRGVRPRCGPRRPHCRSASSVASLCRSLSLKESTRVTITAGVVWRRAQHEAV